MPRCVCGQGEMMVRAITYTEYKPDGSNESTKGTEWETFCDVCGLKTGRYESVEEAVQAFKDYDFVNCYEDDWYNEEGW